MAVSKATIGLICALLFAAFTWYFWVSHRLLLYGFPHLTLIDVKFVISFFILGIAAIVFSMLGFKESKKIAIAALVLTTLNVVFFLFSILSRKIYF